MTKQSIVAIEYSPRNICIRTDKNQVRIRGDFDVKGLQDVIAVLEEGKIINRYSGIETLIENVSPGKKDNFIIVDEVFRSSISSFLEDGYVVDYANLPLFVNFINTKTDTAIHSVLVRMHETRYVVMKGSNDVLYRALYNLVNQGAYSQIASQLINEGGRRWTQQNEDINFYPYDTFQNECERIAETLEPNTGKVYSQKTWSEEYDLAETIQDSKIDTSFNGLTKLEQTDSLPILDINPFGFVSSIEKSKSYVTPSGRTIYFYRGQSAFSDTVQKPVIKEMNIGGLAENETLARLKAYAEAAERHCSGIVSSLQYEKSVLEIAPLVEKILGRPTPQSLIKAKPYPTVRARSMRLSNHSQLLLSKHNEDVFLPLDVVYYPYRRPESERFAFTNSSGCAAHSNYYDATVNAMLELSERDSLMVMWLNKLSLPIITKNSLPQSVQVRIDEVQEYSGMEVILLDATLDKGIPTIISIIRSRTFSYPHIHIGAGASTTLDEALNKAINELESLVYFSYYFDKTYKGPLPAAIEAEDAHQLKHHYLYYHNPEKDSEAAFMVSGKAINYRDMLQTASLDQLFKAGGNWYVLDLTNKYFDEHNIKVVRVFSTELVPIWFGQDKIPYLKNRIKKIKIEYDDMRIDKNPHKHPFLHPMG
jgi:thiazole/oxazole-forming peptide maturase SagD family component